MWAVLLGALVLADEPKKAEPDRQELKKLTGHWVVVEQVHGGKKTPLKELAALSMEVAGGRLTIREGTDIKEDSRIVELAPRAKPAGIDLKILSGSDINKVVKGIYRLQGDTLTVCVAEPDRDRPTAFAAKEGTGHTLFVFKRTKK